MPEIFPPPPWLERANRLAIIARLLSSTVHDVNNALQVIGGSAELLQMATGASEVVLRRGQAIGAQARRASELLGELMAFVRDGREQPERTGLKAMAAQGLAMRHYSLTKLRVTPTVDGDEHFVEACPRHVLQIILNLVMNAERASADVAEPRLRLSVQRDGDRVSLTVEDNGRSVPDHAIEQMFEAPSAVPGVAGDLGIGLSVSRWLAGLSGGTLVYAPVPGGGSQLTLSLPASRG